MAPYKEGIYRANLEALSEINPDLLKSLNGLKEASVPVDESVEIKGLKNPTCVAIVGFSTSKILDQIINIKDKSVKYIIVIEPNVSVFYHTMRRRYIGGYLKDKRIDFMVGMNIGELKNALYKGMSAYVEGVGPRASFSQHPEIIPDPFLTCPGGLVDKEGLDLITKTIIEAAQQVFISMGCAPDSWNRWFQTSRNFKNLQTKYNMKKLVGKFKNTPIVVVGAGPSMDDFVKHAKKYKIQNKALIIACDASLRRLLKEGIRPHIVTRCERKLTSIFEGVKREDTKDIFFASYPWVDPAFFDLFEESFMLFRGNGVCNWTGYDHLQANGGVSSANAALELAYLLAGKDNDIVLSGIDLVMIGGKTHVGGTKVEFDIQKSKKLWTEIKCNDGEKRTTIPVWNRCLNEYINALIRFKKDKNLNVLNTSKEGADIHGANFRSWEQIKSLFETEQYMVKKIRKNIVKPTDKDLKNFEGNKKTAIKLLNEVRLELKDVFNNSDDSYVNVRMEEEKILYRLKVMHDPTEFFKLIEDYKRSLKSLYSTVCTPLDKFREKYYMDPNFSNLILDTLQLDCFKCENRVYSLKNVIKVDWERLKLYAHSYLDFFKLIDYYCIKMIQLLEGEEVKEMEVKLEEVA